jgi:hypothetical protein
MCRSRRHELPSNRSRDHERAIVLVRATYVDLKKSAPFAPDLHYLNVDGGYSALK